MESLSLPSADSQKSNRTPARNINYHYPGRKLAASTPRTVVFFI